MKLDNQTKMKSILAILVCSLMIISCQEQDYLHEKYLIDGEITYIGKSEFVKANPGWERIEAVWALSVDPKALYTVIEVGGDTITIVNSEYATVDSFYVENEDGDLVKKEFAVGKYLLEDLEVKDYTLTFYQTDGNGNTSIKSEAFTTTYGSTYQTSLVNQSISSMNYIDKNGEDGIDSLLVAFNKAEGAIGLTVSYEKASSGAIVTDILKGAENSILLTDTKSGSEFSYSTRYLPKNGIDTVSARYSTETVPYGQVPKNNWTAFSLPDNTPDAYGWVVSNLWDGSTGGNGFHTPAETTYPVLFSIDLGLPTIIKSFRMAPRPDFYTRFPNNIEIWMSNTANEVGVASDDLEWEAKATAAGWVKLASTNISPNSIVDLDNSEYYRFLRVRILSVLGGDSLPVNIMEIYLTGEVNRL